MFILIFFKCLSYRFHVFTFYCCLHKKELSDTLSVKMCDVSVFVMTSFRRYSLSGRSCSLCGIGHRPVADPRLFRVTKPITWSISPLKTGTIRWGGRRLPSQKSVTANSRTLRIRRDNMFPFLCFIQLIFLCATSLQDSVEYQHFSAKKTKSIQFQYQYVKWSRLSSYVACWKLISLNVCWCNYIMTGKNLPQNHTVKED